MLSEAEALNADHQALITSSEITIHEFATANSRMQELTEQLSTRPSIPLNVTDPAVSLSGNQEVDETGKQILATMPKDMKRQLKKQP